MPFVPSLSQLCRPLREEYKIRMSERKLRRLLRKKLGPKWEATTGQQRKLYSDGIHKFLSTLNVTGMMKSREMRCDMYGDMRNAYRI